MIRHGSKQECVGLSCIGNELEESENTAIRIRKNECMNHTINNCSLCPGCQASSKVYAVFSTSARKC